MSARPVRSPPRILALGGPTASGKSALALALAEELGAAIVSADSVQVYRGLDVGSAKPDAAEQARVPHFGLDLLDPTEQGDAARYADAMRPILAERLAAGRPTIVCGGTGLYFRALFAGLAAIPAIPEGVRAELAERVATEGLAPLASDLARLDPLAAARVAPNDRQRVLRALAVVLATGRPLSAWQADPVPPSPLAAEARFVALLPERGPLRLRIADRARAMVAAGMLDEVSGLLARGVPPDAPGLQSLGYRAAVAALIDAADPTRPPNPGAFAERLAIAHGQYAKRQLTWFGGGAGRDLSWQAAPDRETARTLLLAPA
jgi:tRNA dimethylallyltransferase